MIGDTILLVLLMTLFCFSLRLIFGKKKRATKIINTKLEMKKEKLKELSDLAGKMKEEFVEKAKQGDKGALSRAGEMTLLMHELEKSQSCQHNWTTDMTGRYYCTKCGEDGGCAWDC